MPRFVKPVIAILVAATLVPLALAVNARVSKSSKPPVHLFFDMDVQPKFKGQRANPAFADGRAARHPIEGTVARGELLDDDAVVLGKAGAEWVAEVPVPITADLLARGRDRFGIFCATCHGLSGDGHGPVALRAQSLEEGTWTPPSDLHAEPAFSRPPGHLYNSIRLGIRNMPAYGPQVPVGDRWAIVAYVLALRRSWHATAADVPEEYREALR
jgi:mono/diheme cytochrome c family protein